SVVPESWMSNVYDIDDYEEDMDDVEHEVMLIRRMQVDDGESDELKGLCNRLVNGAKNASSVKIKEIEPIAEEELLKSYCGNVVYWNNSHECKDEMIKTQMPEVIMRLTKDRMNTLDINNKISNQDRMYLET
ncbi:3427_t:CDS:1, partial [Dentiscutata heterogama]